MDAASVIAGKTNEWAYSLPDGVNTSRLAVQLPGIKILKKAQVRESPGQ
jgi:hypothetical protein